MKISSAFLLQVLVSLLIVSQVAVGQGRSGSNRNQNNGRGSNGDVTTEEAPTTPAGSGDEAASSSDGASSSGSTNPGQQQREARLIGFDAPNRIDGRYIVKLTPGSANEKANNVKDQVSRIGGGDVLRDLDFDGKLRAITLKVPPQALNGLRRNPNIEYIEVDRVVDLSMVIPCETQTMEQNRWFMDRLDQQDLPLDNLYKTKSSKGENVTVYVLDTGVFREHEQFEGRVVSESLHCVFDTAPDGSGCTSGDKHGHGTHMAGSVGSKDYGIAPKANIVSVKVFNDSAQASIISIFSGLQSAFFDHLISGNGPSVVSMSLAAPAITDPNHADAAGQASLEQSIEVMRQVGMTVVAAAGNNGALAAELITPARSADALTVGCLDQADKMCSFSSYGPSVDVLVPGVSILSTWNYPGGYWWLDGTSSSAALLSGAVADYLSDNPTATPLDVRLWLILNGARDKLQGPDAYQGSMRDTPNLVAQVQTC